jgi:superfamily II DNA helicase RecQ
MKEILKTTLLEYDKSSFLIDLIRHDSNNLYISIKQNIHKADGADESLEVKINPSVLSEIMEVLTAYRNLIPKQQFNRKGYLSEEDKEKIQTYYLKGISIKDLTIQFHCSAELIEQILRNHEIEIVNTYVTPPSVFKKKKKVKKPTWTKAIPATSDELCDEELYTKLKNLRTKISKQRAIPPFVIFQNVSLKEMAIQKPTTMDELTKISGVGSGKAVKYGRPFLDMIKEHVKAEQ